MSPASSRMVLGQLGERLAVSYLRTKGYAIVGRNYRSPSGEIDIVAREGRELVFVEVRIRATDEFGSPLETIDGRKKDHLRAAAADYLARGENRDTTSCRFDVVGILLREGGEPRFDHVEDAFYRGEMR